MFVSQQWRGRCAALRTRDLLFPQAFWISSRAVFGQCCARCVPWHCPLRLSCGLVASFFVPLLAGIWTHPRFFWAARLGWAWCVSPAHKWNCLFCVCSGSIAGLSVAPCCKTVTALWKQLKRMIQSQRYSTRGACWPNVEQGRSPCDRRGKWHLSVTWPASLRSLRLSVTPYHSVPVKCLFPPSLAVEPRMNLSFLSSCLHMPSTGLTYVCHHT